MILTAHQPVYLPWLGLFHKIAIADKYVFFDGVQYLTKDWNNRNKIKTSAGEVWLTTPVLSSGHRDKIISEIEINNKVPWGRKHWKTLELNYRKAPYFTDYAAFFEETYLAEWKYLSDLNEHMLSWFLKTLGIEREIIKATDLGLSGAKSDLVLDMCKKMQADTYIFGAQGRNYAVAEEFDRAGIKILFQDYKHPVYPQLHGEFIPYLSIADLLFNCGPESLGILMSGQEGFDVTG